MFVLGMYIKMVSETCKLLFDLCTIINIKRLICSLVPVLILYHSMFYGQSLFYDEFAGSDLSFLLQSEYEYWQGKGQGRLCKV